MADPIAPSSLAAVLVDRAATSPDALAFADRTREVTYGQLLEGASAFAGGLARLGVQDGDHAALVLPAGIGFVEAFYAVQLLGALPCAFNPSTPPASLAREVAAIGAVVTVSEELDLDRRAASRQPDLAREPGSLAFLQRTSGTTGDPRVAMITQANVLAQMRAAGEMGHLSGDDVLVSWVPPWHDMGLVRFIVSAVWFGAPCHIVPPAIATIPAWLAAVGEVGGTHTAAPDFAYRLALRLVDPAAVDLSTLRFAGSGGEPVRASTVHGFEERFAVPGIVSPGYGLAEATLAATAHHAGQPVVVDEQGNVSNGTACPGIEVRVEGGDDGTGEILVRGTSVFAGYLDAPEDTAAVLRGGWLHTGDTGYLDDDGRLFVLGRTRAMIKRGGGVVAPRRLEEAAHTVGAVRRAAAFGVDTLEPTTLGERVVVVAEVRDDDLSEAEAIGARISAAIREDLGFGPNEVHVVPRGTIPMTSSGKIRYGDLRDRLGAAGLSG